MRSVRLAVPVRGRIRRRLPAALLGLCLLGCAAQVGASDFGATSYCRGVRTTWGNTVVGNGCGFMAPGTPTVLPVGPALFAPAGQHELVRLTRVALGTGRGKLAGRSYAGFVWESAPPVALAADCDYAPSATTEFAVMYHTAGSVTNNDSLICMMNVPDVGPDHQFVVDVFDYSGAVPDQRSTASRFLIKASFGPTRATIEEYVTDHGGDASSWLTAQMAAPGSLHRAYVRARSNPRPPNWYIDSNFPDAPLVGNVPIGADRPACATGSRWSRAAFSDADRRYAIRMAVVGATTSPAPSPAPTPTSSTHTISWGYTSYGVDASITIKLGDTVRWVLVEDGHDVVSANGVFNSDGLLNLKDPAGEWSFTFDASNGVSAGQSYDYYCTPHSIMVATIAVDAADAPATSSPTPFPTPSPTPSPSAHPNPCHIARCGGPSECQVMESFAASNADLYGVRCCSDHPMSYASSQGWRHFEGCPYCESDHMAIGFTECQMASSFLEAEAWCAGAGARLCTAAELDQGCCRNTDCDLDSEIVWTADVYQCPTGSPTPRPTPSPTPSPTNSPSRGPTWAPTVTGQTWSPTTGPTNSPTPACRMINRGDGAFTDGREGCVPQETNAISTGTIHVSCCTDTEPTYGDGWRHNEGCPWCERNGMIAELAANYCNTNSTYFEAVAYCTLASARLCTAAELQARCCLGTGCSMNSKSVWTSDACDCPSANAALRAPDPDPDPGTRSRWRTASVLLSLNGHSRTVVDSSVLELAVFNPTEAGRSYSHAASFFRGRSMLDTDGEWTAGSVEADAAFLPGEVWFQMDLGRTMVVTGIAAQGTYDWKPEAQRHLYWNGVITSFEVHHSTDNVTFTELQGQTFSSGFMGNTSYGVFPVPITARHVRLVVQTWDRRMQMRAGVTVDLRSHPPLTICEIEDWVGGEIRATLTFDECVVPKMLNGLGGQNRRGTYSYVRLENPAVRFTADEPVATARVAVAVGSPDDLASVAQWHPDADASSVVLKDAASASCLLASPPDAGPLFATVQSTGETLLFDRRIELVNNTVASPALAATSDRVCVSAPRTFVNKDTCVIGQGGCSVKMFADVTFALNSTLLTAYYARSAKFIFAITGLRHQVQTGISYPSPCTGGQTRWIRRDSDYVFPRPYADSPPAPPPPCSDAVDATTRAAIAAVLQSAVRERGNDRILDVVIDDTDCSATASAGISILVGTECWENTHPEEESVYDFTRWTSHHPGGRGPIVSPALNSQHMLVFPYHHDMHRWNYRTLASNGYNNLELLGRLGDEIDFRSLASTLQTDEIAELVSADTGSTYLRDEACGSPGEVGNDPIIGNLFPINLGNSPGFLDGIRLQATDKDPRHITADVKVTAWSILAVNAPDQLRQRMAWAMSQVFVVTELGVDKNTNDELFTTYYDIFIRHAFGNYRDVLREVSYSPAMAMMLSFLRSKSFSNSGYYPDENYAREVMQLFSLGLWQLNDDGTRVIDANGDHVPTYTQHDVTTLSRAWTGFEVRPDRGNTEPDSSGDRPSFIDAMLIRGDWRDPFPKTNMIGGYVGDGLPVCSELPERAWLRQGAAWSYLGASPCPQKHFERGIFCDFSRMDVDRVYLNKTESALFAALCQPDGGAPTRCQFQSEITLPSNLGCYGLECELDVVKVVGLKGAGLRGDGTPFDVYFEHLQRPCIERPFIVAPIVVTPRTGMYEHEAFARESSNQWPMCADPRVAHHAVGCCMADDDDGLENGKSFHLYTHERATLATATARYGELFWVEPRVCHQKVQVDSNGAVRMVDHVPNNPSPTEFARNSIDRFPVVWSNRGTFPTVASGCVADGCEEVGTTCLCSVTTSDAPVFTDPAAIPSRETILAQLFVGGVAPDVHDSGDYVLCTVCAPQPGVTVFTLGIISAVTPALDTDTVFAVEDTVATSGNTRFFKNVLSTVTVDGGLFSFRNPPMFFPRGRREERQDALDAEHETEAVLDTYFNHPTTPAFISTALIQRIVTSNPSPRYVQTVATAFKSGRYQGFGSGTRGDLAAATAAILLDQEASAIVLDNDGERGLLREPLVKMMHLFRALELDTSTTAAELLILASDLEDRQGQLPYNAPSVFNFYQHDFQPEGPMKVAGLVAPEAALLSTPVIIDTLNLLFTTIKTGVTSCVKGAGQRFSGIVRCREIQAHLDPRSRAQMSSGGGLAFTPAGNASNAAEVVAELDVLLTGGRMSAHGRHIAESTFNSGVASCRNTLPHIGDVDYGSATLYDNDVGTNFNAYYDVALSNDGTSVYVVNKYGNTLLHYARDPDGSISTPTPHTRSALMKFPTDVAVSGNGASVYVIASGRNGRLVHFRRDIATGTLTAPVAHPGSSSNALNGASSVVESPDGAWLYVFAKTLGVITQWALDPNTGAPGEYAAYDSLDNDVGGLGHADPGDDAEADLRFVDNVAMSPDGTSLYASCNLENGDVHGTGLYHISRDPASGNLTSAAPYMVAIGLECGGIAVSPDGNDVYCATSFFGDGQPIHAVMRYARDTVTGALSGSIEYSHGGTGTSTGGDLVISADGRSVYIAYQTKGTVLRWVRDPATGVLCCHAKLFRFTPDLLDLPNVRALATTEGGTSLYAATATGLVGMQLLTNLGDGNSDSERAVCDRAGLAASEQIMAISPEFSSSAGGQTMTAVAERVAAGERQPGQQRSYKAVVYIFLAGGVDSFNLLMPFADCGNTNLTEQYQTERGTNALAPGVMLPLDVATDPSAPPQPCGQFATHPQCPVAQQLYNDGDALWVANAGLLTEPLTKQEYTAKLKPRPSQLFAHNTQQKCTQTLTTMAPSRTDGVLGRMLDTLHSRGFRVGSYSINKNNAIVLNTNFDATPRYDVVGNKGVESLDDAHADFLDEIDAVTSRVSGSPFAESWSIAINSSIGRAQQLSDVLEEVELETEFSTGDLTAQLSQVAKLIRASQPDQVANGFANERDTFFVSIKGFDVHSNSIARMEEEMAKVNEGIRCFSNEMKAQGLWDHVTVVEASEFGRTLTSNGQGVDHGWAGNYLVAGGSIKGKRIMGEYPDDLSAAGPQMLNRGRVLPSTSWNHIWNPIAQWMGVHADDLDTVLPDRVNFDDLYTHADLYEAGAIGVTEPADARPFRLIHNATVTDADELPVHTPVTCGFEDIDCT